MCSFRRILTQCFKQPHVNLKLGIFAILKKLYAKNCQKTSCVWTKLSTELKISCTSPGYTYIYIKDNTTRMICYISQPFEEDSLIYKNIYLYCYLLIYTNYLKKTTPLTTILPGMYSIHM